MILVCPNCSTRYSVPDAAVAAGGRQVKCTRCAHVWWQTPDSAEPAETGPAEAKPAATPVGPAPAEPVAAASDPDGGDSAEPEPPAEAPPAGRRRPALSPAPSGRERRLMAGWALLALFVAGLAAALLLGRAGLEAAWPPVTRLYAAVGLPPAPAGEAFLLQNTRPQWQVEGGRRSLLITAEIANRTEAGQPVPPIRIALRDDRAAEIHAETVAPGVDRLGPGETAPFQARITPPAAATVPAEIVLSFVPAR